MVLLSSNHRNHMSCLCLICIMNSLDKACVPITPVISVSYGNWNLGMFLSEQVWYVVLKCVTSSTALVKDAHFQVFSRMLC